MIKHSKILALFLALSFAAVLSGIAEQQAEKTVTCPVGGKEIKKSEAKATSEYKGKTYYFCCEKCKEKFMKDPEKYTQKKAMMKEVYTCSMHPEVKSCKPGKCSKCGMNLQKKMVPMKHMCGHMKAKRNGCCAMMSFFNSGDVDVSIENLENGVAVKIISENADIVKKVQEMVAKMKSMCSQKAGCCKKEVKKEETSKQ